MSSGLDPYFCWIFYVRSLDLPGLTVFDCFCFLFLDFSSLADDPVVPDLSYLVPGVSIFFVVLVQLLKSLGETSAVYIKITYPCMTQ